MIFGTILSKLRSFFRLEPAPGTSFSIETRYDFFGQAFMNRLWYHGDAYELNQFFSESQDKTTCKFWSAAPTPGLEIRKCHTGIPQMMVDMLASIVVRDLSDIGIDDGSQARRIWDGVCKGTDTRRLFETAVKDVLVVGDGAFKICVDPESEYPLIEWVGGDKVTYRTSRGRVVEVIFETEYDGHILLEKYGYGYVRYGLYKKIDRERKNALPLDMLAETKGLSDVVFDNSIMLAVPFMITSSDRFIGRGKSIYDSKADAFDTLDEVYSQWIAAMRASRPVRYIPEALIPRDFKSGTLLKSNPFDCAFIKVETDNHENAKNEITVSQPTFNAEQYNATYITALDLALQGIISPSTLGIDMKKLDNAEATREKEKATLYTRNRIIAAFTEVLKNLVRAVIGFCYAQNGVSDTVPDAAPVFGEYANPSFEAVVETLSNPNTPMSVEAKVEELWGDTKDDEWKQAEVKRIMSQSGIVTMDADYE